MLDLEHESGRKIKDASFDELIGRYAYEGDVLCYDQAIKIEIKNDSSELNDSVENYNDLCD